MKKIYFVVPSLNFGGGERVVVNIANNMDFINYQVKIIALRNGSDLENSINKNIEIIKFNKSRVTLAFYDLIKYLYKNKPDIIFSGAGDISILLAFLKKITFLKKIKILARERGVITKIFENTEANIKSKVIQYLYKNFLGNLDILIVQSEIMKSEFIKYVDVKKDKLKVFYNPLDLKNIDFKSNERIGSDLNLDKINLLSVGRLEDVKNHLKMLGIFQYLDKNKYILNIVGDGKNYKKISDKIKELNLENNVKMLGFSDNPYKYMKNSDILLITSDREALPNVGLEANACGCTVISLNCPGGVKEIIKNGENGYIVDNIEEMSYKIENLKKNRLNREDLKKYAQKYNVDNYIAKLEEIL